MDVAALKKEAKSKKTAASRLEQLARHSDTSIQLAVANNPSAPASALEYLGGHGKFNILKAVAKNPNTPDNILEKLATHKQETVLEALLERSHLPLAAVEALGQRLPPTRRWWLPWKFASVVMSKPALLEKFLTDPDDRVRQSAAEHLPLSDAHFEQLLNDPKPFVRAMLYQNASLMTDANKAMRLLAHPDEMTRAAVAQQSLSATDIQRFVNDASPYVRAAVVRQLHITEAQLEKLANDPDAKVRGAISGRFFSTPVHLLERLSKDPEPYVRAGVAQNGSSTEGMLEHLSHDENEIVRFAVVCNSEVSEDTLERLSLDTSPTRFKLQEYGKPDQELTIAERAKEHLRQKRQPKSAESFPQPFLTELFADTMSDSKKSFEDSP